MPYNIPSQINLNAAIVLRQGTLGTILSLAILVFTASCGNKITTRDVPVAVPETFSLSTGASELEADWWKSFRDPALNSLIDSALFYNLDLKSSWYR